MIFVSFSLNGLHSTKLLSLVAPQSYTRRWLPLPHVTCCRFVARMAAVYRSVAVTLTPPTTICTRSKIYVEAKEKKESVQSLECECVCL